MRPNVSNCVLTTTNAQGFSGMQYTVQLSPLTLNTNLYLRNLCFPKKRYRAQTALLLAVLPYDKLAVHTVQPSQVMERIVFLIPRHVNATRKENLQEFE